jgi:hypothetical protein
MEYAIYPFDYIRITQRHDEGNHLAHWNPFKDYADKPWDEGVKDSGRSYFMPQNDYVVEEILEVNWSIRLRTLNKVKTPYKDEPDYLKLTLTHIEKAELEKVKVGQILKKGSRYLLEGKGGATAYHFHITANFGNYYDIKKNANGKYCFVYDKSLLPDEAFYVDPSFTTILDARGYNFKQVPLLYKKGDSGKDIEKIADFLSQFVKGNYYGDYMEACVNVYKKQNGISGDGKTIDSQTLEEMKRDGLKL